MPGIRRIVTLNSEGAVVTVELVRAEPSRPTNGIIFPNVPLSSSEMKAVEEILRDEGLIQQVLRHVA